MTIKNICELIDARKNELFEILGSLIKINSENFRSYGNEKEIAEYIHSLCLDLGLESEMYSPLDIDGFDKHPDYMEGRNLQDRYNVTARWRGENDKDELMLMGHHDTVEIGDIANWSINPLCGEVIDGKIYGRGANDDKYALAVVLFIFKLLKENNFKPKSNILFTAYCDEEHGGSHGALAAVLRYPCPRILNMDAGGNQIWNCASGGQGIRYFYHTKDTVDSSKLTAEAIPVILEVIEEFGNRRRDELKNNPYYAGSDIYKTALRYMGFKAGNDGMDLGRGEVSFTFYTDKSKEQIEKEILDMEKILQEKLGSMGIISDGFKPRTRFFHYVYCPDNCEDIDILISAAKEAGGQVPVVCGSCLSDLSVINKYGSVNAFAYGIGNGFEVEGGSHQKDERIECDKLVEYTKNIAAFILKISDM